MVLRKDQFLSPLFLGLGIGVLHTLLGFAASCWRLYLPPSSARSGVAARRDDDMAIFFSCSFFPSLFPSLPPNAMRRTERRHLMYGGRGRRRHMAKIAQNDRRICGGRDGKGERAGPRNGSTASVAPPEAAKIPRRKSVLAQAITFGEGKVILEGRALASRSRLNPISCLGKL